VLPVLAALADQVGPLPQVGPQLARLLIGPKGRSQPADAMQPVDPLAVPAVGLGSSAQLAGVARIDQEHLEALRREQLIQSDPVDARRFHGDGVDLMLMQEGGNGFQARRVGRKFLNQAGIGCGGEADADPVGAGTDVDAGGVRMVHGQRFDLGGLLLTKGFALGLGPGLATVIGLAVGAGLGLRAAGRGGGWFAFGSPASRCRHGGTPSKERGDPYSS
jgi:hypothetical protein